MSAPNSSPSSTSSSSSSSSSGANKAPAPDKKHINPDETPVDETQFASGSEQPAFHDDGMFRGADSEEPICPYDYDAPFSQDVFRSLEVLPAQQPSTFAGVHAAPKAEMIDIDAGTSSGKTGLELAMSLMMASQPQRVLSPMPAFVEPNTTLYSTCNDASRLFDCVLNAIIEFNDTQHVLHPKEYVIRGAMFNPSCVIFHVSLFESDSGVAIEFQRRSGDSVDFAKIYQHCNAKLQAENLVAKSPRGLRAFGCPPLPGFDDEATLDDTDFGRLFGMATSPFLDVAREGAGCLANLSRHTPNLPFFRNAANNMEQLVAHRDVEVRRCAATMLANMAFQWADAKQKLSALVAKLAQSATGSDQDLVLMELRQQIRRCQAYMQ